jgi:hypothetical protein
MDNGNSYITALSILHVSGIHSLNSFTPWEEDQTGPQDIRRKQVLNRPYIAFGKLVLPDRLAFSAASLALQEYQPKDPDNAGLFCSIPHGSLSTDLLYRETVLDGTPSPALFSATLPSSPVADIAIYHHIKGPNTVFAGGEPAFVSALEYAVLNLKCGNLSEALVVHVAEGFFSGRNITDAPEKEISSPCAVAMVLSDSATESSSAVNVSLETIDNNGKDLPPCPSEWEAVDMLLKALKKSTRVRFPVSHGRFIGYICLRFTGKER